MAARQWLKARPYMVLVTNHCGRLLQQSNIKRTYPHPETPNNNPEPFAVHLGSKTNVKKKESKPCLYLKSLKIKTHNCALKIVSMFQPSSDDWNSPLQTWRSPTKSRSIKPTCWAGWVPSTGNSASDVWRFWRIDCGLKNVFCLMVPKSVNILDINLCMCVCVHKAPSSQNEYPRQPPFSDMFGCLFLTYSQMECIIKWEECKKDYHHTMSEQYSRNGAVFRVIGDDLRTRTTWKNRWFRGDPLLVRHNLPTPSRHGQFLILGILLRSSHLSIRSWSGPTHETAVSPQPRIGTGAKCHLALGECIAMQTLKAPHATVKLHAINGVCSSISSIRNPDS